MQSTYPVRHEVYVTLSLKSVGFAEPFAQFLRSIGKEARVVAPAPIPGTAVVAVSIPPERHRSETERAYDLAHYSGMARSFCALTEAPAAEPFTLNQSADINGTFKVGELVDVSPFDLIRVFGEPTADSDDGKVNGAFYFDGPDGALFTVYAYKRQVQWSDTRPIDWSIGGRNGKGLTAFAQWVHGKVRA